MAPLSSNSWPWITRLLRKMQNVKAWQLKRQIPILNMFFAFFKLLVCFFHLAVI